MLVTNCSRGIGGSVTATGTRPNCSHANRATGARIAPRRIPNKIRPIFSTASAGVNRSALPGFRARKGVIIMSTEKNYWTNWAGFGIVWPMPHRHSPAAAITYAYNKEIPHGRSLEDEIGPQGHQNRHKNPGVWRLPPPGAPPPPAHGR